MAILTEPNSRITISDTQRKFLEQIQRLDREYEFDSHYFTQIREILDKGHYQPHESEKLNQIRNANVSWKRTYILPTRFTILNEKI